MRLCFASFGRVLKYCTVRATTQNKLVSVLLRSVDKDCRIDAGKDWDNAVNLLLNCGTGLPNGSEIQGAVVNHSTSKTGDSLGRVIAEAQKAEPKVVAQYFEKTVLPLLDPNKVKTAILALCEIIKQDDVLDSDTIVDVIGNKKRTHILSQSEFVASDFLASIFLYTAVSVDNKLGKEAISDITKEFIKNFESQKGNISLVSTCSNSTVNESFLFEIAPEITPTLPPEVDVNELLEEVENKCRIQGCNVRLRYPESGQTRSRYGIVNIRKQISGNGNPTNASHLALCIEHGNMYKNPTDEQAKMLQEIKLRWKTRCNVRNQLDRLDVDSEVRQLLSKFDLEQRNTPRTRDYTVVKTEEKISDTQSAFFSDISEYVALHFNLIGDVIKRLERERTGFSANLFGAQVTLAFESINRADYSQEEIFVKLAEWLKEKTDSTDTTICRIVIAYYVRLCNVFKPLERRKEADNEPSE